jgi:pimeloyl-ACP methyl ester carboxylesterase
LLESDVLRRQPALVALALSAALGTGTAASAAPGWQHIDLPGTGSYTVNYVPYSLPAGQPAPAVVFLHGSGLGPEYWQQNTSLAAIAEQLGFVLVMPRAGQSLNFGIGADDAIVDAAVRATAGAVSIDSRRLGLSGFSAGAAYALVLAYATPTPWSGVFAMAAPYRTVVSLANPSRPPPVHFEYGTIDPNYQSGQYHALRNMLERLGVPTELDLVTGLAHQVPSDASLLAGFGFLLAQPVPACAPGPAALCLRGRFEVEATWQTATGQGSAGVVQLTDESGYLWFFDRDNVEISIKLIDACTLNQRYWVYAAGTTDVRVTLTVTDTRTQQVKTYINPLGTPFQPILDSSAFATCP